MMYWIFGGVGLVVLAVFFKYDMNGFSERLMYQKFFKGAWSANSDFNKTKDPKTKRQE